MSKVTLGGLYWERKETLEKYQVSASGWSKKITYIRLRLLIKLDSME